MIITKEFISEFVSSDEFPTMYSYALYVSKGDFSLFDNLELLNKTLKEEFEQNKLEAELSAMECESPEC